MTDPAHAARRDSTSLQNDISRAIEYRREYYKYVIGISSALLAFTVSFPPDLAGPPREADFIKLAWGGLGVAIMAGVLVHLLWAHFFISHRDDDYQGHETRGKARRAAITLLRRLLDLLQILGLAVGVTGVVVFAAANLDNIKTGDGKPAAAAGPVKP